MPRLPSMPAGRPCGVRSRLPGGRTARPSSREHPANPRPHPQANAPRAAPPYRQTDRPPPSTTPRRAAGGRKCRARSRSTRRTRPCCARSPTAPTGIPSPPRHRAVRRGTAPPGRAVDRQAPGPPNLGEIAGECHPKWPAPTRQRAAPPGRAHRSPDVAVSGVRDVEARGAALPGSCPVSGRSRRARAAPRTSTRPSKTSPARSDPPQPPRRPPGRCARSADGRGSRRHEPRRPRIAARRHGRARRRPCPCRRLAPNAPTIRSRSKMPPTSSWFGPWNRPRREASAGPGNSAPCHVAARAAAIELLDAAERHADPRVRKIRDGDVGVAPDPVGS